MDSIRKLYSILNLPPTATQIELRDAYLNLAMQYHPDKNPQGEDKFIEIATAYNILSDPERRRTYEQESERGLFRVDQRDIVSAFSQFLAEEIRHAKEYWRLQKQYRDADVGLNVYSHKEISLEDLYLGRDLLVVYKRMIVCQQCHGKKTLQVDAKCDNCQGEGRVVKNRKKKKKRRGSAAGKMACTRCGGSGKVKVSETCNACHGCRYREVTATTLIQFPEGGYEEGKVRLPGLGHETYGERRNISDLVVLFDLKHHPKFHFMGEDLVLKMNIPLTEAILGFDRVLFSHLDGRKIKVAHPAGKLIKPGMKKIIKGEGMPVPGKPQQKGDLIIELAIDFPDSLNIAPTKYKELEALLPPRTSTAPCLHRQQQNLGVAPCAQCAQEKQKESAAEGTVDERCMLDTEERKLPDTSSQKCFDTVPLYDEPVPSDLLGDLCDNCLRNELFPFDDYSDEDDDDDYDEDEDDDLSDEFYFDDYYF